MLGLVSSQPSCMVHFTLGEGPEYEFESTHYALSLLSSSAPPRLHQDVFVLLRLDHESGSISCLLICPAFLNPQRSPFRALPGHSADRSRTTLLSSFFIVVNHHRRQTMNLADSKSNTNWMSTLYHGKVKDIGVVYLQISLLQTENGLQSARRCSTFFVQDRFAAYSS